MREAESREAAAAFANTLLVAFGEVEISLASEGFLTRQAAAVNQIVSEASDSMRLSEERYLAGLVDILSVLEARRRHFSARSRVLSLALHRLNVRIDIHAALGGGFGDDRAAPAEVDE
jgi:outer membrane protein TolC